MRDLEEIRAAYERGDGSLRELAVRFDAPLSTLKKRSAKEHWQAVGAKTGAIPEENGTAVNGTGSTFDAVSRENGTATNGTGSTFDAASRENGTATNGTGSTFDAVSCEDGTATNGTGSKSDTKSGSALSESGSTPHGNGTFGSNEGGRFFIPADINSWDRLRAAEFYHQRLGWAVHALYAADKGQENERGKKPIAKGWRAHTAAEVTPGYLQEHFGQFGLGKAHNLGVVVRAPFVHIDLDSKPDHGVSVCAWLAEQPRLASVPRERTGGGAHLLFICRDLPEFLTHAKKALSTQINNAVTAELYTDGLNIVVSPSVHKSGVRYEWEVTGAIPEVRWEELCAWFGFAEPEAVKRGRPKKDKPWWARFKGSLHTLDAVALFREAGLLGDVIDPDAGKWRVRCPWAQDHTGRHNVNGSDTVIFQGATDDCPPGFKCLHAHCAERELRDVLEFLEERAPGIVDRHCREKRAWEDGQQATDGRPRVLLPEIGRADSDFAAEMGGHLASRNIWYDKADTVVAVTLRRFSEKIAALCFAPVQPVEACTAVEQFVETGVLRQDKAAGDSVFLRHTISRECAAKMLAAPQFRRTLPQIIRILDIPLPIRVEGGEILTPAAGYDPRFCSYLSPSAPAIRPMPFDRALELISSIHADFGWRDAQSLTHALASLLTPFCRGLMGWDARFPLWHYSANRPRAGKDYLAGIRQLIYEGRTCEDAPLERESEETRKRITAALMAGRRSMHFANCQGHIQDAAFIGAITSKTFAARNLGSTEAKADLVLPNEIEFSISANVGLTFREDVEPRTRRISLAFFEEDANGRTFSKPDLHGWVLAHRCELLSAVGALIKRWMERGCPDGPTPFNTAPEWGRVVGGIMGACDLGDPCQPHADDDAIGGDTLDRAMRALYRMVFENYPDTWIEKGELFRLVASADDEDLHFFGGFGDSDEACKTKSWLGRRLTQFKGRELSGIVLELDSHGKGDRQRVRFTQFKPSECNARQLMLSIFGSKGSIGSIDSSVKGGEKKCREKNKKSHELNEPIVNGGGGTSRASFASTVTNSVELFGIAKAITDVGSVALDIETFGPRKADALNPWRGDIRLLSLKIKGRQPWLLDLQALGYDLGALASALESVCVIAHNAKFDLLWLAHKCGCRPKNIFCTLTAARLLSAGTKPGNNLDQCLRRYLHIAPTADHSGSDWGGMLLTADQLAYAARDVEYLHALREKLTAKIQAADLEKVCALEMELCPAVVAMEEAGIAVDAALLREKRDAAIKTLQAHADQIRQLLSAPTLNPASPEQLKKALHRHGIHVTNTSEETLKATDDGTIIPLILKLRAAEKIAQQSETLLECVEADGRIHGRFEPTGTVTGRFASKSPNLQNIGRGELRECFIAPPGRALVLADYSQVELRVAAAIADETRMLDAYRNGADLHRQTAALVLNKPENDVTKGDRQLAKAVNFGLLYGQSPKGLVRYAASAYGVELSQENAQEIRSAFFRNYNSLRQWHGESHHAAERGAAMVRTRLGRRRLMEPSADAWERFTALVNTPVQGGSADGMKRAITLLATRLPSTAYIVSTVHDELIVECDEAGAPEIRSTVETALIEAMAALYPEVPILVDATICRRWSQK